MGIQNDAVGLLHNPGGGRFDPTGLSHGNDYKTLVPAGQAGKQVTQK